MEERAFAFLRRLLDAPGPSGFESAPALVWRDAAESFADEVTHDVVGNSYARVKPRAGVENAPTVLIVGHIDEIGFLITHIDKEGFLWFAPLGGWDDQVVVGQRVRILGRKGDVIGVIGKKASHLLKEEDRRKPTKIDELWIDIGAANYDEAVERVEVGSPAVIDSQFIQLTGDRCAARSMDNRVGAFVALEAARLVAKEPCAADVYAIATVTEETTFGGAYAASFSHPSNVAIAVDLTHPTDYPGADKKQDHEARVGGGPVLTRGATINDAVYFGLHEAAARLGVATTSQATGTSSGTDADPMVRTGCGTATGLVSVPGRYMHSPNEVVSLSDIVGATRIIAEFIRSVTPESDFRPGTFEEKRRRAG
jgi:putative aminopeptidase FrvX